MDDPAGLLRLLWAGMVFVAMVGASLWLFGAWCRLAARLDPESLRFRARRRAWEAARARVIRGWGR
jgi:hypothetical protein